MPENVTVLRSKVEGRSKVLGSGLAVVAGAAAVALAAQISVPIPGTAVPFTLQGLAVLLVGGLLGPGAGAAAMVLYLAAGMAGLPVFAPEGLPGVARLLGPTGGYLLAFPVAAAVTGALTSRRPGTSDQRLATLGITTLAALLGMITIHLGGMAQLAILTGSMGAAIGLGALPFLGVDLVKVVLAGVLLARFGRQRTVPAAG